MWAHCASTDDVFKAWAASQKCLFTGAKLRASAMQHSQGLNEEGIRLWCLLQKAWKQSSSYRFTDKYAENWSKPSEEPLPALQHSPWAFPQAVQGGKDGEQSSLLSHPHSCKRDSPKAQPPAHSATHRLQSQRDFISIAPLNRILFSQVVLWMP